MVQPSRNVSLRRRYPLMLNDIQPVKKITKLSGADPANINQGSPTGPTIHEIDTSDVLFKNSDESEITSNDVGFISSDLIDNTANLIEEENNDETPSEIKASTEDTGVGIIENIPEDWLEVEMTEGDYIDPLTPIDPAKVNPAMAAATLEHLKGVNKLTTPISITIPSVPIMNDSGKNNLTEKKVIYLTDNDSTRKSFKMKKPVLLKVDINKKSLNQDKKYMPTSSSDSNLNLFSKNDKTSIKPVILASVNTVAKKNNISDKTVVDVASTPNESKLNKGCEDEKNLSTDPFLKLDSLYNGTICEDQLNVDSPKEISNENDIKTKNFNSLLEDEPSPESLINSNDFVSKEISKNIQNEMNLEPESMAIVCQQPSIVAESLARELNSHVDSVQGELDYLKEVLKGEGYTFDSNNLPWIFNDDLLSYGVLPTVENENSVKKNEETGSSGNELMAYGAPNLMDLVDMVGSTPNNQEWANIFSPVSPAVTDLTTPLPSPSAHSFPNPAKRRKK